MTITYTPGPWRRQVIAPTFDQTLIQTDDGKRSIARVYKKDDAHLIAAAPDLLAALAALIEDCEAHGLTDNDAHLREARNAITKAKGQ